MKLQNYKLELYKPSNEYMGELLVDNLQADIKLEDISSISFTIPEVINGQLNPRVTEVLDMYEVVLSYGDLTAPQQIRFVLYQTPLEFDNDIYKHSYSGFSTESKMESQQIVSWPGIARETAYFTIINGEPDFIIQTGTPRYIIAIINANVSDEDLEVVEVRSGLNGITNESVLIP